MSTDFTPTAEVKTDPEHGFIVYARFNDAGTDRVDGYGWVVRTRALANRLATAIEAGAVMYDTAVRTDVNGATYVSARSRVMAKYANADLRRLGY